MSDQPVIQHRDGSVAVIRLNRPEAMCALNTETKQQLLAALREVAEDPSVRAVVLTGTGKAFCVGQDLNEHVAGLRSQSESLHSTVTEHYNPIVELLAGMPKPVIASLNGVAAGAGMSFALACDVRILSDTAGMNTSFTAIGLSCDSGISWTLQRLVGPAKARELLMMPRTIKAAEALDLGLATQVVPGAELATTVQALARKLADGPTVAYGAIKSVLAYSATHDLADSLANEGEWMSRTGATADHTAAVDAFLAKKPAQFQGR